MLNKALQILNNMHEDENVLALKNIISSYANSTKIYMLRYKGKPVTFYITNHDADFSNGSTVYLDTDSTSIYLLIRSQSPLLIEKSTILYETYILEYASPERLSVSSTRQLMLYVHQTGAFSSQRDSRSSTV